jgi:hypothetical protein
MKYFTTPAEIRKAWNEAKQGQRLQIAGFLTSSTNLYETCYFFLCEYAPARYYRPIISCGATTKEGWGLRITQIVTVLGLVCDCTPRPLPKPSFPKTPPVAPVTSKEEVKPLKEKPVKTVPIKPPTIKIVGKRFRIR